jgi:hypothetical protein
MERREFLKLTLGLVAAAGAIAGTAAQAAPLPQAGNALKPTDPADASAQTEADKLEQEVAARDDLAAEPGDTDFSARRWWRRRRRWWRRRYRRRRRWWGYRRRYWRRRRRRWWRRRRVIYY